MAVEKGSPDGCWAPRAAATAAVAVRASARIGRQCEIVIGRASALRLGMSTGFFAACRTATEADIIGVCFALKRPRCQSDAIESSELGIKKPSLRCSFLILNS